MVVVHGDPGVGLVRALRGVRPAGGATGSQPPPVRASSDTESCPNVSRSRSTIASAVSWPVSTDCDSDDRVAASARARAASEPRREARSTTVATPAATPR